MSQDGASCEKNGQRPRTLEIGHACLMHEPAQMIRLQCVATWSDGRLTEPPEEAEEAVEAVVAVR